MRACPSPAPTLPALLLRREATDFCRRMEGAPAPQMCWVKSNYVRRLLILGLGLRQAGRRPRRGGPGSVGTLAVAGLPEQAELSLRATRALSPLPPGPTVP
jgi:hypothetical protein